jgi:hypothetical protein
VGISVAVGAAVGLGASVAAASTFAGTSVAAGAAVGAGACGVAFGAQAASAMVPAAPRAVILNISRRLTFFFIPFLLLNIPGDTGLFPIWGLPQGGHPVNNHLFVSFFLDPPSSLYPGKVVVKSSFRRKNNGLLVDAS